MLNLLHLRVLAAGARQGSVTGAAKELHYSQPSVSHHLARLEAETGGNGFSGGPRSSVADYVRERGPQSASRVSVPRQSRRASLPTEMPELDDCLALPAITERSARRTLAEAHVFRHY